MTDGDALLAAVLANPADDTPRLVYADWLDENGGDEARAEFIRVQIELARLPREDDRPDDPMELLGWKMAMCREKRAIDVFLGQPHACELCLERRERELFNSKRDHDWLIPAPLEGVVSCHNLIPSDSLASAAPDPTRLPVLLFTRGFVSHVTCSAADWLAHAAAILKSHPVERVTLTTDPEPWHEWIGDRGRVPDRWPSGRAKTCRFTDRWPGVAFELPESPLFDPAGASDILPA